MFPFCLNNFLKILKSLYEITIYSQGVSHGTSHPHSQYVFIVEMGKMWVAHPLVQFFKNLTPHE